MKSELVGSFSFFCITVFVYNCMTTDLLQLFWGDIPLLTKIELMSFFLLPVGGLGFIGEVLGGKSQKVCRTLMYLWITLSALALFGEAFQLFHMVSLLLPAQILLITVIVSLTVLITISFFSRNKDAHIMGIGYLIFLTWAWTARSSSLTIQRTASTGACDQS